MSCCVGRVDGQAPGGGSSVIGYSGFQLGYEVDFSAQPDAVFANGNVVIDGVTWVVENMGGTDSMGIVNGSGLTWGCAILSTQFNATAQTAILIRVPVQSLWPDYTALNKVIYQFKLSAFGFTQAANRASMGVWKRLGNEPVVGDQFIAQAIITGTGNGAAAETAATIYTGYTFGGGNNTLSLMIDGSNPGAIAVQNGAQPSGWPVASTLRQIGGGNNWTASIINNTNVPIYSDPQVQVAFAFPTGSGLGPSFTGAIERFRILYQ